MTSVNWTVIDNRHCAQCKFVVLNKAFKVPLPTCNNPEVSVTRSTDRQACIVARSPHGLCGPQGKYWGKA